MHVFVFFYYYNVFLQIVYVNMKQCSVSQIKLVYSMKKCNKGWILSIRIGLMLKKIIGIDVGIYLKKDYKH